MKRLLTLCLLGICISSLAQQKQKINTADLLKSQKFAFIANKIEKRPGTNGSSGYNYDMTTPGSAVVASTTTIQQSLAFTSNNVGPGSAYTNMYYRSAEEGGSYFSAYGIPMADGSVKKTTPDTNAIYFNWEGNDLMISNLDNPQSLNDINGNAFKLVPSKNIKSKLSSKKDGSAKLTLKLSGDKGPKTIYLSVQRDGKAVLQTPPNKHESTYIHRYIIQKLD